MSVDPSHPFPYISNLSLNLAAVVRDPMTGEPRFARVKMPPLLSRFLDLPDGERFVPLEEVIAAHLDQLFPGMDIVSAPAFRVTRDADVEVEEDEADDLLAAIETVLQRRRQRGGHGDPARDRCDDVRRDARNCCSASWRWRSREVFVAEWSAGLGDLCVVAGLERPELKDEPWTPVTPPRLRGG